LHAQFAQISLCSVSSETARTEPTRRLIGSFLRKQATADGEMSLEPADFEMQ
jgi:hypothetical protein